MRYEEKFLLALAITVLIETITLFALAKTLLKKEKITNSQLLFTGFIASFSTLPYLWFVLPVFLPRQYFALTGELIVVAFEAIIIQRILKIRIKSALIVSVICNVISSLFGLVFFA